MQGAWYTVPSPPRTACPQRHSRSTSDNGKSRSAHESPLTPEGRDGSVRGGRTSAEKLASLGVPPSGPARGGCASAETAASTGDGPSVARQATKAIRQERVIKEAGGRRNPKTMAGAGLQGACHMTTDEPVSSHLDGGTGDQPPRAGGLPRGIPTSLSRSRRAVGAGRGEHFSGTERLLPRWWGALAP
jgi:hypothetical protein